MTLVSAPVTAKWAKQSGGPSADNLVAFSKRHAANHAGDDELWDESDIAHTLNQNMNPADVVAFDTYNQALSDQSPTLRDTNGTYGDALPAVTDSVGVRRLTPVECERLQGFPDYWTAIDGEATPDGKRYAALGDAVTVPVAQWIGERLVRFG